jgi:hypothetical protein
VLGEVAVQLGPDDADWDLGVYHDAPRGRLRGESLSGREDVEASAGAGGQESAA